MGQMLDSGGSPKHNSEFFAKGLLQAKSGEVTASGKELSEVKVWMAFWLAGESGPHADLVLC